MAGWFLDFLFGYREGASTRFSGYLNQRGLVTYTTISSSLEIFTLRPTTSIDDGSKEA